MRIKLNLDKPTTVGRKILVHGAPNAGKTYLAGAFLRDAIDNGGSGFFINTKGEDGTKSLVSLGLGDIAETVEDIKDLKELTKDLAKDKHTHIVLDALKYVWTFAIDSVAGKGNVPKTGGSVNHWSTIHKVAENALQDILDLAPNILVLCPSDKSTDQIRDEIRITPDLPGRMAAGIAGSFDAVGYLEGAVIGSKVRRTLHFETLAGVVTRLRAGKELTKGFTLSSGPGCWGEVDTALTEVDG